MSEFENQLRTELEGAIKALIKTVRKLETAVSGLNAIQDSTDPMGIARETLTEIDAIDRE